MKCCASTDVGISTNWLTFEPDPDHSPDAGTGIAFSDIVYALLPGILRREIFSAPLQRAVVLKWFYSLSRRTTFVGGKCVLPSAALVWSDLIGLSSAQRDTYVGTLEACESVMAAKHDWRRSLLMRGGATGVTVSSVFSHCVTTIFGNAQRGNRFGKLPFISAPQPTTKTIKK